MAKRDDGPKFINYRNAGAYTDDPVEEGMDLDAIIADCSVSPEAAQALADAMPRLAPSGGAGLTQAGHGADRYASSSGLARKIADSLKSGDVIGYATRDALDEATWDAIRALVGFTDQGNGEEVDCEEVD